MVIEKALGYCRSILQNVSRSFALTIPLVEKNIIAPILVGYLEARILDSFEDEGKNIGTEKRIENINKVISIIGDPDSVSAQKFMKEVMDDAPGFIVNPHYLDLTKNMDKVMAVHRTMSSHEKSTLSLWFGRMAEGMQKYLNKRIDTFEQLDEYCYYVGGTVGGMVTDLLIKNAGTKTSQQISILRKEQNAFGLFLQKVNIIRDFREDIMRNEKIFWPYQMFEKRAMKPPQALEKKNERKSMDILDEMITNAEQHVSSVKNYITAIPEDFPGFQKASAINFLLGVETLEKMDGNPDVFYGDPVKIDRSITQNIVSDPMGHFAKT